MQYQLVDAALDFPAHLTRHTVTVLIIDQQIRQIAVPQITGKSVLRRQFQQPVHTVVEKRTAPAVSGTIAIHQPDHIAQNSALHRFLIDNQFFFSHLIPSYFF